MYLIRVCFLALLSILQSKISFSQNGTYGKAISLFKEGKLTETLDALNGLPTDPQEVTDALFLKFYIYNDIDKDKEAYLAVTEFLEKSSNPFPYCRLVWFNSAFFGQNPLKKERLKYVEKLIENPNVPGEIKSLCYRSLGQHYLHLGNYKKSAEIYKMNGALLNWSMTGSFDNISGGGFDKDYGVLSHPETEAEFTDRNGAKVKWFVPPAQRQDQWIDMEYFFATNDGITYAQSFVNSPDMKNVQIRVGHSGSIKVWLNDGLILEEEKERNNLHDSYIIETRIQQGVNRILVQVGDHEINASDFMIRITDEKGNPISGLSSESFNASYKRGAAPEVKLIMNFHESFFQKMSDSRPDDVFYKILLSRAFRATDRVFEPRNILTKLEMAYPNNPFIKGELISIYNREENANAMKQVMEWFKDHQPNSNVSLILWMNEENENKNYKKVDSLLEIYSKNNGENETYLNRKISLYFNMEETQKGISLIREAYRNFPENKTFIGQMALVNEKVDNNITEAGKVYSKYLKKHMDVSMWYELADIKGRSGDFQGMVAIYQKIHTQFPYMTSPRLKLAEYNVKIGRYSIASTFIEECIRIAPYVSRYYTELGEIYSNDNEKNWAELNYKKSLEFNIHNYDARRKLRLLQSKQEDIFDYLPKPDVANMIKQAPGKDKYPDDNSIILSYDRRLVIYETGATEEKTTLVVKMLTNAGVDTWKQFSVPSGSGNGKFIKAEIFKSNGSKQEAEMSDATAQFTNLEPGDAIHMTYAVEYFNSGRLKNHFYDDHTFQFFVPVLHNRIRILKSPAIPLNYTFNKDSISPEKGYIVLRPNHKGETTIESNPKDTAGNEYYQIYNWEVHQTASLKEEPLRGNMKDISRTLFVSTIPDWNFISNWYYDLSRIKQRPEYDVKEKSKVLFEGKSGLSDLQKAEIIYEYIVKNVRYSNELFWQSGQIPQEAAQTINNRQGDCKDVSTLFVALAREAGLKNPRLVLVNNRANGRQSMMLPSTQFDHCIASYEDNGETRYIELTSDFKSLKTIDFYLKGSFVLPIYGESEKVKVNPFYLEPKNRVPNVIHRKSNISFENRDLIFTTTTHRVGTFATGFRSDLRDISEDERKKYMTSALASDFGNVKLNSFKIEAGLQNQSDSVRYFVKCQMSNALNQIAGMNIFTIPWNDGFKTVDFANNEDRVFDVEQWRFAGGDGYSETMTIELPTGKVLAEAPKDVLLKGPSAAYSLTFKISGNTITATRTLTITGDIVPVAEYKDLRKFWQAVVSEDTKQFAFK